MQNKPSSNAPSRLTVLNWLHSFLSDISPNTKIEEFGKGVAYCRIINHFYPGAVLLNRIIWNPKIQYENTINMRIVHNTIAQLKINIQFDPSKVAKEKIQENWALTLQLYRHFNPVRQDNSQDDSKNSYSFGGLTHTLNGPKRTIEQVYGQHYYYNPMCIPFMPMDISSQKSAYRNSSKYSVGKLHKQNSSISTGNSNSPNKGKWSVNSHMFQNNLVPLIDRIKEILLKSSHDIQKIRQIKMLLNIPLNQEVIVKVENDEQINQIIKIDPSCNKQKKIEEKEVQLLES